MNTAKKAGRLCVCASSAATRQEQLQEPVVLENYDNKVLLCRNKIMGEVSFNEFRLGCKGTSTVYCCDGYLYEDIECVCVRVATFAIDPDFSRQK